MEHKAGVAFAALIAGLVGVFFTVYMVSGHSHEHMVEILIAQFIGNGLLAAILVTDAKLIGELIFAALCLGLLTDVIFIAIATKSPLIIIPSALSAAFLAIYAAHLTVLWNEGEGLGSRASGAEIGS